MMGQIQFIVNPTSGSSRTAGIVRRVITELESNGRNAVVRETSAAGEATHIAAQLPADTAAAIVVGGDGTIREVAQGLEGRSIPIAILPAGTENLIAKHFGIRATYGSLASALDGGRKIKIDVGTMGKEVFLTVGGIGFDAEVVWRLTQRRSGHITKWDYVLPIVQTFFKHRYPVLHIEADGMQVFSGQGFALIGNIPRYAVGLPIFPMAVPDDGKLDLCIFPTSSSAQLIGHAFATIMKLHVRLGRAHHLSASSIKIESDDHTHCQLDGDCYQGLPLSFGIKRRVLDLLLPNPN